MEWIGVVDCNNFFVSCERLFRPDLRTRPVVVLSSNDGCVVARSQEVKDMGVPMGVPYFKIKDIVKDNGVTTFSSHFALYRDISARVFTVLKNRLPMVEQYSIDEAFFTLQGSKETVAREAAAIKSHIEQVIGIPVSIGVAATKTQAKLAVDRAKKTNGILVLSKTDWEAVQTDVPLGEVWGVGRKLAQRCTTLGLKTVPDFLRLSSAIVDTHFGIIGRRLQLELSGVPVYRVTAETHVQQSMVSSRSFQHTTEDISVLEDAVAYHVRNLAADLRRLGKVAPVIRVSIRPSRFSAYLLRGGTVEQPLSTPTSDTIELLKAAHTALSILYETGVPYKKAGVSVPYLLDSTIAQPPLFGSVEATGASELMSLIDTINSRAGQEVLGIGNRQKGSVWQARRTHTSPAYTTKWTDVAHVHARD